jgi:hypothetical protein
MLPFFCYKFRDKSIEIQNSAIVKRKLFYRNEETTFINDLLLLCSHLRF